MHRAIRALTRHIRHPRLTCPVGFRPALQWRPYSTPQHEASTTSQPPNDDSNPPEVRWYEKSQLAKLSMSTRRLLQQGRTDGAMSYFKRNLDAFVPPWRTEVRVQAYATAVNNFIDFKDYTSVDTLGRYMMNEGCLSSDVKSKMIAVTYLEEGNVPESEYASRREALLEELKPVVSSPHFTDRHLRHLIDLLYQPPRFNADICTAVAQQYTDARDPDDGHSEKTENRLINLRARDRFTSAHDPVLDDDSPLELDFQHAEQASPYTTLLSALASDRRLSQEHTDAIMKRMAELGVAPDLALFNALINAAVLYGDFYRAFALYDALCQQHSTEFIPDAFTFGSLFKAVQAMHQKRTARTRPLKVPPNARSGRVLFREMAECHRACTRDGENGARQRSAVVSRSTLNVALRMFLFACDYPAALVVLGAFREYGIAPDTKTYRVVLLTLLAHVRLDLSTRRRFRARDGVRWVDRFWSGTSKAPTHRDLDVGDTAEAIDKFLFYAARPGPGEKEMARVPSRRAVLTVTMEDDPRLGTQWPVEPLLRLLTRAIWASMAHLEGEGLDEIAAAVQPVLEEMTSGVDVDGRGGG